MKKLQVLSVMTVCLLALVLAFVSCDDGTTVTYTITFDTNGGVGRVPSPQTAQPGHTIFLPNREGLSNGNATFDGWNANPTGGTGTYQPGDSYTVPNRNVTLYALWNASSSTLVTGGDNGAVNASPVDRFQADSYTGNDKVKYSYTYNGYDFYYIYLGEMANIPIYTFPVKKHDGIPGNVYTVSMANQTITAVEETVTTHVENTITTIEENSYSKTTGGKLSAEVSAQIKILGGLINFGGAKTSAETYWQEYIARNTAIIDQQKTSLASTVRHATTHVFTCKISDSFDLTYRKAGYYRYTWFSASSVYLYVIKDSKTDELVHYEFKEHIIPDAFFWDLDYSETPSFSKSNATGFELDISILENLPKPVLDIRYYTIVYNANGGSGTISRSPNQPAYAPGTRVTVTATANTSYVFTNWTGTGAPAGTAANNKSITVIMNSDMELVANFRSLIPKTTTQTFTSTGTWVLGGEVRYPATIEIYALGAGGGGQGGHYSWRLIDADRRGTGGAGGGGAATYIRFSTAQQLQFNVTVGKGGVGGNPRDSDLSSWSAGYPGTSGGSTTVRWGTNTITAAGGSGGGGTGRILDGGSGGGFFTAWPTISRLDQLSVSGRSGTGGDAWGDIRSTGGDGGFLTIGSINPFGGGRGGVRPGGVWAKSVDGSTGGGGSSAYGGVGSNNHGGKGGDGLVTIVVKWDE